MSGPKCQAIIPSLLHESFSVANRKRYRIEQMWVGMFGETFEIFIYICAGRL